MYQKYIDMRVQSDNYQVTFNHNNPPPPRTPYLLKRDAPDEFVDFLVVSLSILVIWSYLKRNPKWRRRTEW